MLLPNPNHPSALDEPSSDGSPSAIYDLDDGTVHPTANGAPINDPYGQNGLRTPFTGEPEDPLARDVKRVLGEFHALGYGIRSAVHAASAEFRSVYTIVRSEKGILNDFLAFVWDNAAMRVRRILPIVAVMIVVPLAIVGLVRLHKKHPHRPSTPYSDQFSDNNGLEKPTPTDPARPGASGSASPGVGAEQDPVRDMPPALQVAIAKLLALGKESHDRSPGKPGSNSMDPLTAAGVGEDEPSKRANSIPPDVFTNSDENGIMRVLYKVYADQPNTDAGREAGETLAQIYWRRAGSDFQRGHAADALTDWKRVAKFDPGNPIAQQARQKMQAYGPKTSKKPALRRPAAGKNAKARNHPAAKHSAKAKSRPARRGHGG